MSHERKTLMVPLEMAIACCSPVALATLRVWLERGARPSPHARVMMSGNRLMAVIDFRNVVSDGERPCDGVSFPLIVTLYDAAAGEEMLERVKAGDRLVDRFREQLGEGRP